jgi:hypothetical protein
MPRACHKIPSAGLDMLSVGDGVLGSHEQAEIKWEFVLQTETRRP